MRVPSFFCNLCAGKSASAFGEAGDCFGFSVEHFEDGEQFGDLQDFLKLAAEMAKAQSRALGLGAVMRGHQGAQAGAVDEGDVVHVEDNLFLAFGDQGFNFFAQRVAFFAEHDTAVHSHHCDAVHFAIRHLQCHVVSSSSAARSGDTGLEPQSLSDFIPST